MMSTVINEATNRAASKAVENTLTQAFPPV